MRIALDVMGGDFGASVNLEAAHLAKKEFGYDIVLVGKTEVITPLLKETNTEASYFEIVHASQEITMDEHPANAVKAKPDSSMVVGMKLLKNKQVDALVTMGNSGGGLAAALFHLGRIKGIVRPCLSTVYPTMQGWKLLLDIGANADCKPIHLIQFAMMGSVYAEKVLGLSNPKVSLVSNGEEDSKGSQLVQEVNGALRKARLTLWATQRGGTFQWVLQTFLSPMVLPAM